jgi:hypothetical protein
MTTHLPKLIIYIYPNLQVTFSIAESSFVVLEYSESLAFRVWRWCSHMIKCSEKYNNPATAPDHWLCCVTSRVHSHKSWYLRAGAEGGRNKTVIIKQSDSKKSVTYQSWTMRRAESYQTRLVKKTGDAYKPSCTTLTSTVMAIIVICDR